MANTRGAQDACEFEEINYLYLEISLENLGMNLKTLHAKNGKEAVEICKENPEIELTALTNWVSG